MNLTGVLIDFHLKGSERFFESQFPSTIVSEVDASGRKRIGRHAREVQYLLYRGTSPIRNSPLVGPYRRNMPRDLW